MRCQQRLQHTAHLILEVPVNLHDDPDVAARSVHVVRAARGDVDAGVTDEGVIALRSNAPADGDVDATRSTERAIGERLEVALAHGDTTSVAAHQTTSAPVAAAPIAASTTSTGNARACQLAIR